MVRHKHYTFRNGQQVLEHAVKHLRSTSDALERLHGQDNGARVDMLLDSVMSEQSEILQSVERLLADAPDKLINTYTQYTVEMPTEFDPPDELTEISLIQWLGSLNGPLQEMFKELAENHDSEQATDVYAGLAQQLESHEMRLSKEFQRMQDI